MAEEESHACSLPHLFSSCCILALVAHAAVVRLQQAASNAKISSPSLSQKPFLFSVWLLYFSLRTTVTYRVENSLPVSHKLFSFSLNLCPEGGSLLIWISADLDCEDYFSRSRADHHFLISAHAERLTCCCYICGKPRFFINGLCVLKMDRGGSVI